MKVITLGTIFAVVQLVAAGQAQTCGQRQVVLEKIISNEYTTQAGTWPWHGALFHRRHAEEAYTCGVSILTERFVITCAHCAMSNMVQTPAREMFVLVGVTNLDHRDGQQHDVARIIQHDKFDVEMNKNDLALLEVSTNITYNLYVQPICLWQGDTSLSKVISQTGYTVGWGSSVVSCGLMLNEATMPIVTDKECVESDWVHYSKYFCDPTTFCAGYRKGKIPTQGDSGGGLFLQVGKNWVLRGILSSSKKDTNGHVASRSFAVFMDVSKYVTWIKNYVVKATHTTMDAEVTNANHKSDSTFINEETNITAQKCGQKQIGAHKLISRGLHALDGVWPWHGALFYELKSGDTFYHCGVTIITERFVITVASCTLKHNKPSLQTFYIKVGLTDLDSPEQHVQELEAARIIQHDKFNKAKNNIALIELSTDISFNDYIQPICLWQGDTNMQDVVSQVGYVVGWDHRKPMVFNEMSFVLVSKTECIESDSWCSSMFYSEPTTFCAQSNNGTNLSLRHLGGGLFLKIGNDWFLRGIFSFGEYNSTTEEFNLRSFTMFTDVSKYIDWIKINVMTDNSYTNGDDVVLQVILEDINDSILNDKITDYVSSQQCGQRKIDAQKLIFNGYKALPGAWPWHGALFHRLTSGQVSYACGVTIIRVRFVITTAHCTIDQQKRRQLPADRVYVKVGLTDFNTPEWHVQQHEVAKIIQYNKFNMTTYENNIALIELTTDITYNEHIQPICLLQYDTKLPNDTSQIGYIVGWRDTENGQSIPNILNKIVVTIVSEMDCILSDSNFYLNFYFELTTFCAQFSTETNLYLKYTGGGLFLQYGNSWVLRGIISFVTFNSTTMGFDMGNYVIFTNISKYIDWIEINAIKGTNNFFEFEPTYATNVEQVGITDENNSTFIDVKKEHANLKKCGQRKFDVQKLIFNGYKSVPGAWPWHGAMFHRLMSGQTSYACGVTIITEWFVITTAHCTLDQQKRQRLPADGVYIKVGLTDLNTPERHVQQHEVARIIQYKEFNMTTYENNIALIELSTDIIYNDYIQPICFLQYDIKLPYDTSQVGYVVGWRDIENDQSLPNILNEVVVTIVSEIDCILSDSNFYLSFYFKSTTFCAQFSNETNLYFKYTGGGLFLKDGNSWILRGILSFGKFSSTTMDFDIGSNVIFTDVLKYIDWMKTHATKLAKNSYEIDPTTATNVKPVDTTDENNSTFVDVIKEHANPKKCGKRKFDVQKLIFNGYKALPGAWPWHGAMFHKLMAGQTSYACGVTVLTERFVVTAAHCTIDQQERQRLPADRVSIKVGLTNLESPERHAQQHSVVSIIRHEEYDEETFENDIALMKLYAEITFSDYVQPVCLWRGDTSLKNVVSQIGYTVGWGYNEHYGLPKHLNEATMPIVSRKECVKSDPNSYRKFYFESITFCAGYRNGTSAAPGDSGGGLFLLQGNSWVLRGIISNTKLDPNTLKINSNSFVVFVDVSYYLDWIKNQVGDVSIAEQDFSTIKVVLICMAVGFTLILLLFCILLIRKSIKPPQNSIPDPRPEGPSVVYRVTQLS